MTFTSLDTIVRRTLINKQLPLHYYIRFLSYAAEGLRELTFSTLGVTNTVNLTLNSYFAVDLPCDFSSIVAIGIPRGQFVQPVTQRNTINNLTNYNGLGQPIPYDTLDPQLGEEFPFFPSFWLFSNVDDIGEPTGRLFGTNTGLVNTSYKLIPGRQQIQFDENFPSATVILEYVANAENPDNATKVDTRAIQAIQAYIDWQWKKHSRKSAGFEIAEAREYFKNEWRQLRARIAGTSLEDIRQSLMKAYYAAPKI